MAATSSAPRALPWAASVPWAFGAGQAMIVSRTMSEGLSETSDAARTAS